MVKYGKKRNAARSNLISKSPNLFEIHINRQKYDVIGQKTNNDRGFPGVSRSIAQRKREKTLLQEYKTRYKSGKLVDKRIGEKNPYMDPEHKILLRNIAEKRRQFSKKSIFNLNDDVQITHKGKSLTEETMNDKDAFSDEDDDDDLLDADFVKQQHFGGDFLTIRKEGEEKAKTRKEWMEEIIAESKQKKADFKKEKFEQEQSVSNLDSQYQQFLKLMSGKALTDEEKVESMKKSEFKNYDVSVRELLFDRSKRAQPTGRLKSDEEIAREQKEKLDALEKARLSRMQGSDHEEDNLMVMQSADALNNEDFVKKDRRFHVSYKGGVLLTGEEDESLHANKADMAVIHCKDKEEHEHEMLKGSQDSDNDNGNGASSSSKTEQINQIKKGTNRDSEFVGDGDIKLTKRKSRKDKNKETKVELSEERRKCEDSIPFTFEVPNEYERFWQLIQGRTPSDFTLILERMIACNHPSLGAEKRNRCNTLFAYLLQTLHVICSVQSEAILEGENSFMYIDPMIPFLFRLTQFSPPDCASALIQVVDEKYENYQKTGKRYPYADTFIFLKLAGLLFPSSDYHHEVMTRVVTILTQFLGESKVNNRREITSLLFTAALLHEYLKTSERFIGELSNALNGVLYLCIPTDQWKLALPRVPPFRTVGVKADLLVLGKETKKCGSVKLSLATINDDLEITDDFKICALHENLRIFSALVGIWSRLPSARTLFSSVIKLLNKLPIENYPSETSEKVSRLRSLIAQLPPHPQRLVKDQASIKVLRMLEPKIEKIYDGIAKRRGPKEKQEQQRLLHKIKRERKGVKREFRRDAAFLAREQLKETLRSDAQRKAKVNIIMQGLASQESEFRKFRMKSKK